MFSTIADVIYMVILIFILINKNIFDADITIYLNNVLSVFISFKINNRAVA